MTAPKDAELIEEFVELAKPILTNPWVLRSCRIETKFEAAPDGPPGHGTWTLSGPSELELDALILHLRNVIQPRQDLHYLNVLDALERSNPDPECHQGIADARIGFRNAQDVGTLVVNNKPVVPWRLVAFWMYSSGHHRDLSKRRQLRALDEISRFVYRGEFLNYLGAIVQEVDWYVRAIRTSRERGYLQDVTVPEWVMA